MENVLPKLFSELRRSGLSDEHATVVCNAAAEGVKHPPVTTLAEYQKSWVLCHAAENALTTLDDGSTIAAWFKSVAQAVCDFEIGYKAKHGYLPLHPGSPETTDGPHGSA